MDRRSFGRAVAATPLLALASRHGLAQPGPTLNIVVPYGPGGTTDLLGRLMAQHFARALGRAAIVENRPGAGSTVGATFVARAVPDGNTLLVATSSTLAINPSLYPKLQYDPVRDFAPIGMIAAVPLALVVPQAQEARDVAGLIGRIERKAAGFSYGSAGNGSPQHLAAEMFKAATGAKLVHVPYNGSAAALTALLGGQLEMMFVDLAPALPHIQSGRLRALAVTSLARQPTLPDVPPLADLPVAGLAQFEAVAWQSLVAPAATPTAVVETLSRLLAQWLAAPATRDKLAREGLEPRAGTPEELAATLRADTDRWSRIVKTAGISLG